MGKHTLIITEKPDAAKRIAFALDLKGKPIKRENRGVPYYLAKREKDIIVVPALGHLYTIVEEHRGRNFYPVYQYKWVPKHLVTKNTKQTQKWLETITKLARDAATFIDACDYDVEGSIIGYHILKYVCINKEKIAKRMKFSSLTKEELETSYLTMLPHLDFPLIEAGLTRHEVDWLYGVNLSRALTITAKNYSGRYMTISTGRVQGPTLGFLVAKEKAINRFVPKPFWELKAYINLNGSLEAKYENKIIKTESEATAVINKCKGKDGRVEKIDIKQFSKMPPTPFNLGTLQIEAYTLFGYLPRYTLNIVQRLYLEALISYPRTDSQKLPPTINFTKILRNLSKTPEYRRYSIELLKRKKLSPHNGKKDDPAHPAIYPTGNVPEEGLLSSEKKVLDLIIRRFMAVFGKPTIKKSIKVTININENRFHLNGIQTLNEGWQFFYKPYIRSVDILLPQLEVGQTVKVLSIVSNERFTKPPSRYNPSSLLKRMEEKGIGTKSTRTGIIQTLYNRKYITHEKMVVTDMG